MNPHRVPVMVIAFLLVNVAFIVTGVAQDAVVASANGYVSTTWYAVRELRPGYYMIYGGGLTQWLSLLFGLVWLGLFGFAGLITLRACTGRSQIRGESVLWWVLMAFSGLLAAGLASYVWGPYSEMRSHWTSHFHPATPAHILFPVAFILLGCLGLKSFRNRVAAGRHDLMMERNGAPASAGLLGSAKREDAG